MSNPLCDAGCLGFPTFIHVGAPVFSVFCDPNGELVAAPQTIHFGSRQAGSEASGATLVTGLSVPLAYINPAFVNPFDNAVNVIVDHEFAIEAGLADADWWEVYGDINCTGTGVTLSGGGTTGQFLCERNDGRAFVNNNEVNSRFKKYAMTMIYTVPAFTSFNIGMLVRLEAEDIRGGFRGIFNGYTAMTVSMQPRYV